MPGRPPQADDGAGAGIGRRDLLGAGLAGAGLVLLGPAGTALARPAPRAAAPAAPAAGAGMAQLPVREQFAHLPAIPLDSTAGILDTLSRLSTRSKQVEQARQGLTERYVIGGRRATAYELMYGPAAVAARRRPDEALREDPRRLARDLAERPLARLEASGHAATAGAGGPAPSLEHPAQFSMGWTTLPDVRRTGLRSLPQWAASLSDAGAATRQFWPMIAEHGLGYNLIVPERVTPARARALRRVFGPVWARDLHAPFAAGRLYAIDMSRFEALEPSTAHGAPRFTPSTITLLTRDPRTGTLTPVAVTVSGHQGRGRRLFTRRGATEGAWLYALQAAKTSITVFGVWLGHVYHWHLVTAAMVMTMLDTLPDDHPVRQLLAPQSGFLIPFDDVLLALWSEVAPPTSLSTGTELLALADGYAAGRSFFDDDPHPTLARFGLRERDFTHRRPWDRYPVVQRLLAVWDLVASYVRSCVSATYRSDAQVAADQPLQAWIAAASASGGGNVRGLPAMTSRAALISVLTSLIHRITVHGVSRLSSSSNPALTFVANFPHCLQRTDIPDPHRPLDTGTLLTYLPNTQTIGQALSFYFTFTFSTPYEPFIPLAGPGADLFFAGGPADPRNRALIGLRRGLARFIEDYQPGAPQLFQWPRNIET